MEQLVGVDFQRAVNLSSCPLRLTLPMRVSVALKVYAPITSHGEVIISDLKRVVRLLELQDWLDTGKKVTEGC